MEPLRGSKKQLDEFSSIDGIAPRFIVDCKSQNYGAVPTLLTHESV